MVSVLADDSGYGKMGQIDPNKKPSKALQWHDFVNVVALPILGTLCLLALLGYYDASKVWIPLALSSVTTACRCHGIFLPVLVVARTM